MKSAFVIQARQKEKHVGKAVASALAQTYPCEIVVSDQFSTDNTLAEIHKAIDNSPRGAEHTIKVVKCPINLPFSMEAMNLHFDWAWKQTSPDCEWIHQLSADDYSLPNRVKVCMEAVEHKSCSAIGTTMYFENPETGERSISGYPTETGYVKAGEGLLKLAYGSCIWGFHRDFLDKVSHRMGSHTPDVMMGYLAALDKGAYVIAEPYQVHGCHADIHNMGFGGRLRAAVGEDALCLAELNHMQLMALYDHLAQVASDLHPEGIKEEDWNPLLNMIFGQARGWLGARQVLNMKKIQPWLLT